MAGWSIRWYYAENIKRWEKLEASGKIGPRQQAGLDFWRKAKLQHPKLISISLSGGEWFVGKIGA